MFTDLVKVDTIKQEDTYENVQEQNKKSLNDTTKDKNDEENQVKGALKLSKLSFDNCKSTDDFEHHNITQELRQVSSPSFKIDAATFDQIEVDVCKFVLDKPYQFNFSEKLEKLVDFIYNYGKYVLHPLEDKSVWNPFLNMQYLFKKIMGLEVEVGSSSKLEMVNQVVIGFSQVLS